VKLVLDEIIYHCLDSCEDEREIKISKNYVNKEIGSHYFASHTHIVLTLRLLMSYIYIYIWSAYS